MKLIVAITSVLLTSTIASCGGLVSMDVKTEMNEKSETVMGTNRLVIMPGCTSSSSTSMESGLSSLGQESSDYVYTCDNTTVQIKNQELFVGEINYGNINSGDDILIGNGKVLVANQERRGTPVSDGEILKPDFEETLTDFTTDLAGYEIAVSPGASAASTTKFFGKHTLTVGTIEVIIDNNKLFVGRTAYGELKQGDWVRVERDKVIVSGEIRRAAE